MASNEFGDENVHHRRNPEKTPEETDVKTPGKPWRDTELKWTEEEYRYIMHPTIHQVATMLDTYKNVLFPSHNHLLTTGADDPSSSPVVSRLL